MVDNRATLSACGSNHDEKWLRRHGVSLWSDGLEFIDLGSVDLESVVQSCLRPSLPLSLIPFRLLLQRADLPWFGTDRLLNAHRYPTLHYARVSDRRIQLQKPESRTSLIQQWAASTRLLDLALHHEGQEIGVPGD